MDNRHALTREKSHFADLMTIISLVILMAGSTLIGITLAPAALPTETPIKSF